VHVSTAPFTATLVISRILEGMEAAEMRPSVDQKPADFGPQYDRIYVPRPMSWCQTRRKLGAQDNTDIGKEW
jgi:hypothetical protein